MKNHPVVLFIKLSRPFFLLGGIGQYFLGVSIAKYLGNIMDWTIVIIGLGWVIAMQLATHFLNEYYDYENDRHNTNRTPFSGGSGVLGEGEGKLPRNVAMVAATGMLTITTLFTLGLVQNSQLTLSLILVMVLIFLGAFFYAVPPIKLSHSGIGEFTTAILVGILVPSFGFMLQSGSMDRLVILAALPLTLLILSMLLAFEFPDYSSDQKYQKRTLLVRLGWEYTMSIHNSFILVAFLSLGFSVLIDMPSNIALFGFFPLPLGGLQIWQMRRIAAGGKTNWLALTMNAVVLFGLMTYMLAFAFWTR